MQNLTQIEVTYSFDYGSVSQKRTFATREHWDSLKALTKPLEEEIKKLWSTITIKSDLDSIKLVRDASNTLEKKIKKIIPPYHFIVEDSLIGSPMLSVKEGEYAEIIIPYNDEPSCRVKYSIIT